MQQHHRDPGGLDCPQQRREQQRVAAVQVDVAVPVAGVELHGFLSYLVKCNVEGRLYKVFGYKGKQVRDNIHSYDLVNAFYHFYQNPRCGEVYNMGGARHSNCSMLEAIQMCQEITGHAMDTHYVEENRIGDHIWWISDVRKFKAHYPAWTHTKNIHDILTGIYGYNKDRWTQSA